MTTTTMTAAELCQDDPQRFEYEYHKWLQHYWWEGDWLIEHAVEEWATEGLMVEADSVHYRLAYSQGDGVAFNARMSPRVALTLSGIGERYPLLVEFAPADPSEGPSIERSRRSSSTCFTDVELPWWGVSWLPATGVYTVTPQDELENMLNEMLDEVREELCTWFRNMCETRAHELYRRLVDEYEDCISEAAFIDSCECNEITFVVEDEE